VGLPDPHAILAHLMTSSLKVVRRFAMGRVRAIQNPVFQLPSVSGVAAHFDTYLAEAVLTTAAGTVPRQCGKRLVLPAAMLKAVRAHSWDLVDFEGLVLLCKAALEPVVFSRSVPVAEWWLSVARADDLLTFGGRLVEAAGGGDVAAPNSFGTVVTTWRAFLAAGDTLGGSALADHRVNAQKFVTDSLRLAGVHGRAAMGDTDPLGPLAASFVPAGAAPFDDLDKHTEARQVVVGLSSSLPTLAGLLGVASGIDIRIGDIAKFLITSENLTCFRNLIL